MINKDKAEHDDEKGVHFQSLNEENKIEAFFFFSLFSSPRLHSCRSERTKTSPLDQITSPSEDGSTKYTQTINYAGKK